MSRAPAYRQSQGRHLQAAAHYSRRQTAVQEQVRNVLAGVVPSRNSPVHLNYDQTGQSYAPLVKKEGAFQPELSPGLRIVSIPVPVVVRLDQATLSHTPPPLEATLPAVPTSEREWHSLLHRGSRTAAGWLSAWGESASPRSPLAGSRVA